MKERNRFYLGEAIKAVKESNPDAKKICVACTSATKLELLSDPKVIKKGRWYYYDYNGELIHVLLEEPSSNEIKIDEFERILHFYDNCTIKNCHVVKAILPEYLFNMLKEHCKPSLVSGVDAGVDDDGSVAEVGMFMGLPVEMDPKAKRIRYVVEGDLKVE